MSNMNTNAGKGEIWAIILAAGESKRMKSPKMLLPYKGMTVIEKVIRNVRSSDVRDVMVVLGSANEHIRSVISGMDVKSCYNDRYREGMLSSVICGIKALPESAEAVLVFQGDQPMIPVEAGNILIRAYMKSGKGIIIPVYKGKRGHPLLIDMKYKEEVEKLDADEGLRSLSVKFSGDVLEVDVNMPEIIRDLDNMDDYLFEINQSD
jgi:molybdenum cofactor cytidylyltransferase